MVKKGNIFLLIKSLSKSEKRYFKTGLGEKAINKNYLKLFNIIDKQTVYNENEIKKVFKEEKFVKQLHVTKIYLTELILKSLRNYHSNKSINSKIINLLNDLEILFEKELYDLVYYRIKKAEEVALEYERLPYLLEVLNWKRKLYKTKTGCIEREGSDLVKQENETIKKLYALNDYWNLTLKIYDYTANKKSFKNNPLLKNEKYATTLQSKILHYHILFTTNLINGNSQAAIDSITKLIELLEEHPNRITDDPGAYATALSNKISFLLVSKEWDKIPELIKKVREIPATYKLNSKSKFTVRLWVRLFNIKLEMYRDKKDIARGIVLIKEIQEFIEQHNQAVPDEYLLFFYYQFAYMFFLNKDHSKSLLWLNEIMNRNFGRLHEDVQSYARILGLIIHFELNNIIVLRYAVVSCRRFLKKKKNLQEFETILLRFFSRLSTVRKDEYAELFRNFYKNLFGGEEIKVSDNVLDYIDIKSWLESNINKMHNF